MKSLKLLLTVLLLPLSIISMGQCRNFAKNTVMPLMEDYIPNENFSGARLMPGDQAETILTFYEGQDYRVLVANHPILDQIEFKLLDDKKNVVFDNVENEMANHFDFNVESTQQMLIQIKVPEKGIPIEINPQGCVAIMVGFKDLSN